MLLDIKLHLAPGTIGIFIKGFGSDKINIGNDITDIGPFAAYFHFYNYTLGLLP
ncbi:hypothetical protein SDC9_212181 [bioreactor metagenome]|uniref:Uncharacterized protein n=1 Tax=bioreactor metagenome TaxID=1076179 RepID=A0A645JNS2_9ZZZZ